MNKETATKMIREIAKGDHDIYFTKHAKKRDPEQGKMPLTKDQILNCLCYGYVIEDPTKDIKEAGGWKCIMHRFIAMENHEVVLVLIPETRIIIITAYPFVKSVK